MKRIGLVVGLGVEAGLFYYQALVAAARERNATLNLIMAHADVATANRMARANDVAALADYLGGLLTTLAEAGCAFAAISAATPHLVIDQLVSRITIPIASIIDAARNGVTRSGVKRFALLGTRRVIDSKLYGAFDGFDVVAPSADETAEIDRIYVSLALSGHCSDEEWARLLDLARTLRNRERLDAIVVAGTDLSPLFAQRDCDFPVFDVAQAHVDAIIEAALS